MNEHALLTPSGEQVNALIERLAEAEAAVQARAVGQTDTAVDSSTATCGLLREAQEALRDLENKCRALIGESNDAIYLLYDTEFETINSKFTELFGVTEEEARSPDFDFMRLVAPESRALVEERARKLAAGEELSSCYEFKAVSKDGRELFVETSVSYVPYRDGVAALGVLRDISERKRAEKALHESEEKYRTIFETTGTATAIIEEDTTISLANEEFVKLSGYSKEELEGKKSWTELVVQEDLQRMKEYHGLRRAEGKAAPREYEFRFADRQGNVRDVFLTIDVIPGTKKSIASLLDITARKRAEKARAATYRISEAAHAAEDLQELFSAIHQIVGELMPAKNFYIAVYNPATHMLHFPYFLDEYEEPPAPEKLGGGLTEYVLRTGEPLLASPEVFEELVEKGEVVSIGGPSIDWLGVPLKVGDKTIGVLVVQSYTEGVRFAEEGKDILALVSDQVAMAIERTRTEEALRQSEDRYRTILESVEEGYFEVDIAGNFTFFNDAMCEILGYARDEMTGMNNRQYMDEDNAKKVYQTFNRVYTTGEPSRAFDWEIVRKDGTRKSVEASVSLMTNSEGDGIGFRGIVRDVTERKRAEEKMKHLTLVLRAIRNVNQLITKEKHCDRLLEGVCDIFVETRGYHDAWIALVDESGSLVTTAETGLGESFVPVLERLKRGELTACGRRALSQASAVLVEDPLSTCADCPLSDKYGGRGAMTMRLEHRGKVYGLLAVSVPADLIVEDEEQALFKEAAGDIAFALHSMELEEAHMRADDQLRQLKEFNEGIVQGVAEALLIEDAEGIITFVNPALEEMLGYTSDELAGCHWGKVIPQSEIELVQAKTSQRPAGVRDQYETRLLSKDGREIPVLVSARPMFEEGTFAGVLSACTDITGRKRLEAEIEERRLYLESVLGSAPDAIVALDSQHKVQEWNEGAEKLFGYSAEEARGRNLDDLITGSERKTFEEATAFTRQVLAGEPLPPTEVVRYRQDGTPVDVIAAGSPILLGDKLIGVVAVYTDITERRRMERAVRESERRLRNLFETMAEGVILIAPDGQIVQANYAAERILGLERSEIEGRNYVGPEWEILRADRTPMPPEEMAGPRAMKEKRLVKDVVMGVKQSDGSISWINVSAAPLIDEAGKLGGVVGTFVDITERRRAEQLLQMLNEVALSVEQALTHEEIFAAVAQRFERIGFSCVVLLADETQSRLFPRYLGYKARALKTAEKLTGVKAESFSIPVEAVASYRDVVWERKAFFSENMEEVVRQALPAPITRFSGRIVKMLGLARSIVAPLIVGDKVIGVLSVQSDDLTEADVPAITAFAHQVAAAWRKADLMQDLETSLEDLKIGQAQLLQAQKMEAVGLLGGGVAHEFNNLLTVMQGNAELGLAQVKPTEALHKELSAIQRAAKRAAKLTKQLLAFSRRQALQPQVLDLNRLITDFSETLGRIIVGLDIEVQVKLAPKSRPVLADASTLEQVLLNLALNARDAMPEGGTLSIETAQVTLDDAYCRSHPDARPGAYARMTVADTGVGMDEATQEHLFEPFFSTKEVGKGPGLGLAMVYGIVKQHDGLIEVYSQLGEGTRFEIYLPVAQAEE